MLSIEFIQNVDFDLSDTKSSESSDSKRKTSLSITYSDAENAAYPWYFQLRMETDDESEVLSIQV